MPALGTLIAAHANVRNSGTSPERQVSQASGRRVPRGRPHPHHWSGQKTAGQRGPISPDMQPGHLGPELIEAGGRRQVRAIKSSIEHIEVFQWAV